LDFKINDLGVIIYNLFLVLFAIGIRVTAIVNPKAKSWLIGRRKFPEIPNAPKTIWMHSASLGEFEQGRPLLEAIREKYPNYRIILTFFSPSGYESRKNYKGVDAVIYLPSDSANNAERFLEMIKPSLVLWVKYEYWYYYLKAIKKRKIPLLLISGLYRKDQPFFKWYGSIWKEMLMCFSHIFIQNEASALLLKKINKPLPVSLSGDTRFDRVTAIAEARKEIPAVAKLCAGKKVIVAGSTWKEDEEKWANYAIKHPEVLLIIAPHMVDQNHIKEMKARFINSILFSQLDQHNIQNKNVLIIDNIGMLSKLYQYADITYVGGGFGNNGIHNILEAAVYGKPVIIGPIYKKFYEAEELIESGGAFSIQNAVALEKLTDELFSNKEKLHQSGEAAYNYVKKRRGATEIIINHIQENRLLIN